MTKNRAAGPLLVLSMINFVIPRVKTELSFWNDYQNFCPDAFLREMAKESIQKKAFHAHGGGVFSLFPGSNRTLLLPLITAIQTISDYLDNLCDRGESLDPRAFRLLHRAFHHALTPTSETGNYYAAYYRKIDGGYLAALVKRSQELVKKLPGYQDVRKPLLHLASLYSDLQVYKHLAPRKRVGILLKWFDCFRHSCPHLYWWEFSAACGSTLGIFLLLALASRQTTPREAERHLQAYFPWICGIHILLDYLIDLEEDQQEGDLNFTAFYKDGKEKKQRLKYFLIRSLETAATLPNPRFHLSVVKGLPALYLSDPKTRTPALKETAAELLSIAGTDTRLMYWTCLALRRRGLF